MSEKLTKKQLKALQFKSKSSKKAAETLEKVEQTKQEQPQPPKKKTRRRKASTEDKKDKKILFIGNLPYNVTSDDLQTHFKSAKPDKVRVRQDKGIAFLEFGTEAEDSLSRVETALKMHHSLMNNRKINVELTVGGGGNSKERLSKIKDKNEKLDKRRKQLDLKRRMHEMEKRNASSTNNDTSSNDQASATGSTGLSVHPSRLKLLEK
ncbi:hypothetical protein OGAPHI_002597 [Ogataea philodendri]|uniref:RRM domain-containing protein n=1 Tax=Ogataea philodendri TaxID=1378263 RepID=A0A9P8PBK9_9ASCO|nr:uncharacterized protein OGAPHI_002597 [Ogataea philodendri]KAH3668842.1 hypothetical protein OGAPHI_002597 [Ogataea philodendri]